MKTRLNGMKMKEGIFCVPVSFGYALKLRDMKYREINER